QRPQHDLGPAAGKLAKDLPDVGIHSSGEAAAGKFGLSAGTLDADLPLAVLHQISGWHRELQPKIWMSENPALDHSLVGIIVNHHSIDLREKCLSVSKTAAGAP